MSDDFHDSLGPLVPHPTARCEQEVDRAKWVKARAGTLVLEPCNARLQYYANTNPPRQLRCPACKHVSYEVPLTEGAA